jgi:hypothetical protein
MTRDELVYRIVEGLREAGLSMSQVEFQALREADMIVLVAADGRRLIVDCVTGEITRPEPLQ